MNNKSDKNKIKTETAKLKKTGIVIIKRTKTIIVIFAIAWVLAAILILLLLYMFVNKGNTEPKNLPEFAQTLRIKPIN